MAIHSAAMAALVSTLSRLGLTPSFNLKSETALMSKLLGMLRFTIYFYTCAMFSAHSLLQTLFEQLFFSALVRPFY